MSGTEIDAESSHPIPNTSTPARPDFVSGLPDREDIATPRTIGVARFAVLLSLIAFVVPTGLASRHQGQIRSDLREILTERAPDYSASEIGRAVVITLIAISAISVLLSLFELSSVGVLRKRRSGGRTALVALTVIHLPIIVVVSAFRDDSRLDLGFSVLQGLLLLAAAVAALMPLTTHWLHAKLPLAVTSLFSTRREPDA